MTKMKEKLTPNQRWKISAWSRFIGIIFSWAFLLFTEHGAKDNIPHALIQVALLFGCFLFVIAIPDKIIFGKYLTKKKV